MSTNFCSTIPHNVWCCRLIIHRHGDWKVCLCVSMSFFFVFHGSLILFYFIIRTSLWAMVCFSHLTVSDFLHLWFSYWFHLLPISPMYIVFSLPSLLSFSVSLPVAHFCVASWFMLVFSRMFRLILSKLLPGCMCGGFLASSFLHAFIFFFCTDLFVCLALHFIK